jgi:NAD(P)-dependent dehydrogenase (short-subunit alcohol dehydrogenase family)
MRLDNKVALITGATGGMGRASARLFAKEGAAVALGVRHRDKGDALAEHIRDAGGRALVVDLDVTDQGQWTIAIDQINDEFGGLHILMNIVGSNELTVIPDIAVDDWNKIFEINVTTCSEESRPAHR